MIIFNNASLTGKSKHSITNQLIWISYLESINHSFNLQKKALLLHLLTKYLISLNKICKLYIMGSKIYNTRLILRIDSIALEFVSLACFISVKIFQRVHQNKHVSSRLKMIFSKMHMAMQCQLYLKALYV